MQQSISYRRQIDCAQCHQVYVIEGTLDGVYVCVQCRRDNVVASAKVWHANIGRKEQTSSFYPLKHAVEALKEGEKRFELLAITAPPEILQEGSMEAYIGVITPPAKETAESYLVKRFKETFGDNPINPTGNEE